MFEIPKLIIEAPMAVAVAVFNQRNIVGEVVATQHVPNITKIVAMFTRLPVGKHGFHIHSAGDLRGEGCKGACSHFHVGTPQNHGGAPDRRSNRQRHTGDLGNIEIIPNGTGIFRKTYYLEDVKPEDLWGRSVIVHDDEDDLGVGGHDDSHTTGHSGARIGCAIFGRAASCS